MSFSKNLLLNRYMIEFKHIGAKNLKRDIHSLFHEEFIEKTML